MTHPRVLTVARPPTPPKDFATAKSAFGVRPECAWTISGVVDAGTGKRPGTNGGGGSSATNRLAMLEGAAVRQLRRWARVEPT